MTLPESLYALPSLALHLSLKGEDPAPLYQCPTCPRQVTADGIVDTSDLPGGLPRWVCHTCASGPYRLAVAALESAALEAAGPDWSAVRARRDGLLARCDWTQVADAPLSEDQRASWRAYRQLLRNITDDWPHPDAVVWPEPPA